MKSHHFISVLFFAFIHTFSFSQTADALNNLRISINGDSSKEIVMSKEDFMKLETLQLNDESFSIVSYSIDAPLSGGAVIEYNMQIKEWRQVKYIADNKDCNSFVFYNIKAKYGDKIYKVANSTTVKFESN